MITGSRENPILQQGASKAAALLHTLGNEHRLLMLCVLIEYGEMTVSALNEYVCLSQSALSQHLSKLREEGLVTFRRDARALHYRVENRIVARIVVTLQQIFCQ